MHVTSNQFSDKFNYGWKKNQNGRFIVIFCILTFIYMAAKKKKKKFNNGGGLLSSVLLFLNLKQSSRIIIKLNLHVSMCFTNSAGVMTLAYITLLYRYSVQSYRDTLIWQAASNLIPQNEPFNH